MRSRTVYTNQDRQDAACLWEQCQRILSLHQCGFTKAITIRSRSVHLHPSRGGIGKQGGKADDGEYDYRFDTDIVKQLVAGGCIEQVWHEAKAIPRANR